MIASVYHAQVHQEFQRISQCTMPRATHASQIRTRFRNDHL